MHLVERNPLLHRWAVRLPGLLLSQKITINRKNLCRWISTCICTRFLLCLLIQSRYGSEKADTMSLSGLISGKNNVHNTLYHQNSCITVCVNVSYFYCDWYFSQNKSLKIYDLPGHERLRHQVLDQFRGLAR